MVAKFIMVKYGRYRYKKVQPKLKEVPGHFDIKGINPKMEYSLHTEYSHFRRNFDNPIFDELRILKESSYDGIPLLWRNKDWSEQFFKFIVHLVGRNRAPKIIEIHPPFMDYCSKVEDFLEIYSVFERLISEKYPGTNIAIENRSSSEYKSNFLVSNASDIAELMQKVKEGGYKLKLMSRPTAFQRYEELENLASLN